MSAIRAKSGDVVTLGSFANGYPSTTTWGDKIEVVDPGVPLREYFPQLTDPLKLWKTQPSLRKVVSAAARWFAMVPWHAYVRVDDNDRQRRSDSRLEQLFEEPAALVSGYQLINDLMVDRMIFDLCCAVYVDDELVRIPPSLLRIKSDRLGRPREVIIETPAGMDDLDITDAPKIITWGWHPNKAGGVSPMHTLAALLEENRRSVEWRTTVWRTTPKTSLVLTRPATIKKWDTAQRDRFLESWRQWRDNAGGGTPILEDGMDFKTLPDSLNPRNAQDIEGRKLTDAEVASAYFIPPELVGAREGNFSNIDAFRQMLYGPILGPYFTELQQAANRRSFVKAIDATSGLYIEANREAAMAGSFMEQARILQTAVGGPFMTRAEARARLNLPYLDGTDELVTPLNVTEGGQASPTDSGAQNFGGDNADPEAREDQP